MNLQTIRRKLVRAPRELDVLEAYARWANDYPPHAHNALMRAEQHALMEVLPDVRGLGVLDLACGTGRYSRLLGERGAKSVIGLELSTEMLEGAEKAYANFTQGDMRALPFRHASFDLIVCGLAIGHVENLGHVIFEAARVLKQGGSLLYSDFHPLGYLAGWRREFNGSNGRRYAVKHFVHLYSEHDAACRASGLTIRAVREPIIGRDIREDFPGSREIYRNWSGWPAVLIIRADKL